MDQKDNKSNYQNMVLGLDVNDKEFSFTSSIEKAIDEAELELENNRETIDTLKNLKPDCDKLDYILAASSGVLCGIIDIFLVGKPGESPLGKITDKWFAERVKDFASFFGWKREAENDSLPSAITCLEKRFQIPYDQTGLGDSTIKFIGLTTNNHHFKSLGHNPTLLGLFFSILDQFEIEENLYPSHFISVGELISINVKDNGFELHGKNIPSKIFCAFTNWIGHLISDVSGSHSSKRRGAGLPSPFWAWTNDIVVLRRKLNIPTTEFDRNLSELAVKIYEKGFDLRFQTTQFIPVVINELVVRLIYSIRRLIRYYSSETTEERSFRKAWKMCEPFTNPSVKRMLTVAHGTFCLFDIGDAVIRGVITGVGTFNIMEFLLRINIAGIGRFVISVYGEVKRGITDAYMSNEDNRFYERKQIIIEGYLRDLKELATLYDDKDIEIFVASFEQSDLYQQAFNQSVKLAEIRSVPEEKILKTKNDIDMYFSREESE